MRKLLSCSFAALAGAGILILGATATDAADGCAAGFHRNLSGYCSHNAVPRQHCRPGFHAVRYPNGSGYRCRFIL
jgi:hypothetical protein